jgi:hypothetical protein
MRTHMRVSVVLLFLFITSLVCGCVSLPKELPSSYFQPRRDLAIVVKDCTEKPELDSEAGNVTKVSLQGTAFLARHEAMKSRLNWLTAEQIKRDLYTELIGVFRPCFNIVRAGNPDALVLEVTVNRWGWSVPVDPHGLRTEGYDFMFRGTSRIIDTAAAGETVASFYNGTETPIDIPVVEESCRRAYHPALRAFAQNVGKYMFKNCPAR